MAQAAQAAVAAAGPQVRELARGAADLKALLQARPLTPLVSLIFFSFFLYLFSLHYVSICCYLPQAVGPHGVAVVIRLKFLSHYLCVICCHRRWGRTASPSSAGSQEEGAAVAARAAAGRKGMEAAAGKEEAEGREGQEGQEEEGQEGKAEARP